MVLMFLATADELLQKAHENLNTDMVILEKWLDANRLSPDLVKTEYIIITSTPKLKSLDYSPLIKLAANLLNA